MDKRFFKDFFMKISRVHGKFFFCCMFLSLSAFGTLTPHLSHNGFISASGLAPKSSHIATGWTMGFPFGGASEALSGDIEIIASYWNRLSLATPPPPPSVITPITILAGATGQYDSIDYPLHISGGKAPTVYYQFNSAAVAYTNGIELSLADINQVSNQSIWSLDLYLNEGDTVELALASSNVFGFSTSRTIMLITQIPEPVLFLLLPFVLLFLFRKRILSKKLIAFSLLMIICITASQTKAAEFNYQGVVEVEGGAYVGDGYFKFAIGDKSGTTNYWSNDGTVIGEPAANVSINVDNGFFHVPLGGSGMQPIPRKLFSNESNLYLSVWFNYNPSGTFYRLGPSQGILSVPTALNADMVDGYDYNEIVANTMTSMYDSGFVNLSTMSNIFLLKAGDVCTGQLQVSNLVSDTNIELQDDGRVYLNSAKSAYISSGPSGNTTIFKNNQPVFEIE
jgi:hypothetical protein